MIKVLVSSELQRGASSGDLDPRPPLPAYLRDPSYFETPTKDPPGAELQEIPTKDTDTPTSTPPVVQSHASFTIEFDSPGTMKIKDHITKFSTRHRKPQAPPPATLTDVMSSESKVADWLVHSDVSLMRRRPTCEDVYSTKSDLAVNTKTLRGSPSLLL